MSDQAVTEPAPAIELPHQGDLAFGALMDALAPDEPTEGAEGAPAGEAGPAGGPAEGSAPGGPDAPGGGPAADGPPGAAEAPDAGAGAPPDGGAAAGGAEQPAATGQPATADTTGAELTAVLPQVGELSTKFEENITKAFQQQAYEQAREDYERYFEALEKHPRLLVGTEVPRIGAEGMETLRNTEDAKEWQEAVRSLLVQEIRAGAEAKIDESRDFLDTIHASIDLFKNNHDLIPGTKGFNRALADQFAAMAQPYEVRDEDDNKLLGYSIPVQPIIDNLRKQMAAAATPPPPPAPPAAPKKADPPQAGIPSKAGNSSEKEDFSTLFGTIGLPNLQI